MITGIRDVPTGVVVTVFSNVVRCKGCGTVIFNARFEAMATDEYGDIGDGKIRRRFDFHPRSPFCDCKDCIWLSSDDLPIVASGWPVSERVSVELYEEEKR